MTNDVSTSEVGETTAAAGSHEAAAPPPPRATQITPSRRAWLSILPWSALAATFIVTLRVLSVAHLNTQVALELVQLTDVSKVLLGLAVVVFPTMVVAVALYVHLGCAYALKDVVKSARMKTEIDLPGRALVFALLWPPSIALAIAFVPLFPGVFILLGVIILTVVLVAYGSKPRLSLNPGTATVPGKGLSYRLRIVYVVLGLVLSSIGFAMLAFDDTPWLPAERISLSNGTTVIGCVAAESSSQLIVLRNRDRSIITLPVALVRSSVLCEVGSPLGGNHLIAQLFWSHNPVTPRC
jgi:hypothetical protein